MIRKINLSGTWGFCFEKESNGILGEFHDCPSADTIDLPSTTSASKRGNRNPKREDGFLTDEFLFEGGAWFFKTVNIGEIDESQRVELFLERTRITRLWVNGTYSGEQNSLCTPHIYDITDLVHSGENTLSILVRNVDYPTKGGHLTSPDTQSNWNGITGEISLMISEKSGIRRISAYPNASEKKVRLEFETENIGECDVEVWGTSSNCRVVDKVTAHIGESSSVIIDLGEDAALWDEFSPVIYTLKAAVVGSSDIVTVKFGLRDIAAEGLDVTVNGRKTQLRGRHDGMIFPLSGAAPTTVDEWYEYLSTVKNWGFNHVRFHTCCPPDAAFTAADILGIYMQPELPFWGNMQGENDEDFNYEEQEYLIEEGRRMLRFFGDHPSFVMMSLGNELWGSPERLEDILKIYHSLDDRHLYTQGSNNFQFFPNIQPSDDFFSGVRMSRERLIRGSYGSCDAPLGFVQTEKPNTSHSFDEMIFPKFVDSEKIGDIHEIEIQYGTGVKKVQVNGGTGGLVPSKPVITHETGQYCSFPDFDDIPKFTGPLKAYNLEIFRERLKSKNMLGYAKELHYSSGMLAYNCYKLEIEAAMRSEFISGFQLLDLQDFTGQGTALVGMLNAFMEEKKFVRDNGLREKWRGFCSDSVVLCEIDDFVLTEGQYVKFPVILRYMRPEPLKDKRILWSIGDICGELPIPDNFFGVGKIGDISFNAPSEKFTLTLSADINNSYENSYDFEVFPKASADFSIESFCGIRFARNIEDAGKFLENGEKVLYIPEKLGNCVKGFYCSDFWCYPMFRGISESMNKEIPVGTLGLLIDKEHPSLSGFPSEVYSTPQWYEIVSRADCAVLDNSGDLRPIVQMIDNFERNHKLGILYEAKVGAGKLLVCTSRLWGALDIPEIQAFAISILNYMNSDEFDPVCALPLNELGLT